MEEPWKISKAIALHTDAERVWSVLTDPTLIRTWFSDADLEVAADWVVGGTMTTRGDWHGLALEIKAHITEVDRPRRLAYRHWSSLSQFPDADEYYTSVGLTLTPSAEGVTLTVEQAHFQTAENYHHWNFYWNMALPRIQRLAETGAV